MTNDISIYGRMRLVSASPFGGQTIVLLVRVIATRWTFLMRDAHDKLESDNFRYEIENGCVVGHFEMLTSHFLLYVRDAKRCR